VVLAVVAGFAGGSVQARLTSGTGVAGAPGGSLTQLPAPTVSANRVAAPEGSVEQVAAALLPSVVSVLSSTASSAGEGSGVILSADGLILTNNHVVTGASSLQVQFNDGTAAAATVIGADPTDDLAVIKATGVSGLTPATLGTSADLIVGQGVIAVGSPLGLPATVTSGIVSALNRPVRTSSDQQPTPGNGGRTAGQATVINAVQTDAAINPGNSGGPLVDMSGRVIGIDSAIASLSSSSSSGQSGSIGVGFAIPIDQAKRIAQEIIDTGHATHAVLGASVTDATTGPNSLLTIGASIGKVTTGSAADTAGLKAGDVITKVGDQHIDSADALIATIHAATPGSQVSITYTRGTTTDNAATTTLGTATTN
jgi:putative serine protease PepD